MARLVRRAAAGRGWRVGTHGLTEHRSDPTFSVIVPTSGRASLRRTLRRLSREDAGDIEVIVVADGAQPIASGIAHAEAERWPAIRYLEGPATRNWGNAQRMVGIQRAAGRYLMFIDDDDVTKRGAFGLVRQAVLQDPERLILFRMKRHGELIWRRPEVMFGNVSTQQIIVPNVPGKIGSWLTSDRYQSDFDFIAECVELQGEPIWNAGVIAVIDPFRPSQVGAWLKPRMRRWRNSAMIGTRLRGLLSRTGSPTKRDS
jgi:glycosyltransferase involved in cell wall biosynthesis